VGGKHEDTGNHTEKWVGVREQIVSLARNTSKSRDLAESARTHGDFFFPRLQAFCTFELQLKRKRNSTLFGVWSGAISYMPPKVRSWQAAAVNAPEEIDAYR